MRNIRADRAHREIIDYCVLQLETHASFEFAEVLKHTSYELMARSVRWEQIRRVIQADHHMTLWPAVKRFFHRRSKRHNPEGFNPDISPEKFLAGTGSGKKAAGYFRVSKENGRMVLYRLQRTQAEIDGKHEVAKQLTAEAREVGLIAPPAAGGSHLA